ncbi:MAG: hypothetical protein PHY93_01930 [Bacteriovorax sp.]|nr:hypothetical protein [Bacteriovorax sp.]
MKSKKIKILGIVLAVILVLLGGLLYYASTKLKPSEIKRITIEQTKKVFPKAEVALQNVQIGWGLNFNINLEKLSIKALKDNQQIEMMSVDQLVVKVPVWAILTGSGVIEVKLDAPLVNYHEFAEGNNWTYAMGDKKTPEEKKAEEEKEKKEGRGASSALGIFGKSKINVKLSDVAVKYSLRDSSKGEIKVSRFLIKGLNFESSTAFEIASSANFIMKDQSKVAFDTLAIGEFNIADLMKNGSVTSVVIVKVNNISKTGLEWKFPEITTNIDFLLKKDGELSGKLTTTFESQNKISANFKMTKEVEISDINVEIILKDIAAIIGLDKSIDMSKAKLSAKGSVLYSEDKKINANLSFAIAPGIVYSKDGLVASSSVSGDFKGSEISVKVKTEAMDGQINTFINGQFNPNEKFDMAKIKPFDIRVVASGMKIPEKVIRAKLWDKKSEEALATEEASKKAAAAAIVKGEPTKASMGLPPSSVNVEWSSINIGGEDFSGRGKIITSLNSIAIDNMNFKFSKGTGKLAQTMMIGKSSSESKFNLEMANLNLSSFKAFLPPMIENFTGTFTGKVNGTATMFKNGKPALYDVNVVADAKKGEIKKLNISDYINPILANIPVVKDKMKDKQLKIDGNFETLTMKGRFTNILYNITAFDFVGIDKKVQISGSGDIYPQAGSGKTSSMEVNFIDNTGKISDVLQQNVGTKILPLRVTGPGFDMKPDYGYTLSKLAKGALKTKGEEKLKEALQKNLDKFVPAGAKDKVKGLLDGFFKKK